MPKLRINLTNLTAQSSQSTAPVTLPHSGLEEQFILRLPPSLASILNSELAENEYTSPGDLSIKFLSSRTAIVKHPRFIKDAYPAVLMDSPTVMETLKSSNLSVVGISGSEEKDEEEEVEGDENNPNENKNHSEAEINVGQYYKVADLNQILMVLDLDTIEGQRVFNRVPQALQEQLLKSLQNNGTVSSIPSGLDDVTASWAQWPDGLTFPMKSAKQKKFAPRPLHASTVGEFERIEREVERLLKSDGQAIESKFTLIGSNGEVLLGDDLDVKAAAGNETKDIEMFDDITEERPEDEEEAEFEDEEEQEEEEVSSASDIEDMNDFAAEIEDNLLAEEQEIDSEKSQPIVEATPIESETDRLVKDLEAKLAEKQKQAESVSNPLIKARIEDVIRQMEDNLRNLRESK